MEHLRNYIIKNCNVCESTDPQMSKNIKSWIKSNFKKSGGKVKLEQNDINGIKVVYEGQSVTIDFNNIPNNTTFNIVCNYLTIMHPAECYLSTFDHIEIKDCMIINRNGHSDDISIGCPKDGKNSSINEIAIFSRVDKKYDLSGLVGTNINNLEIELGSASKTHYYNLNGLKLNKFEITVDNTAGGNQRAGTRASFEGTYSAKTIINKAFYIHGLPSRGFDLDDQWGLSSIIQKPYENINADDYKNLIDMVRCGKISWSPRMIDSFHTFILYNYSGLSNIDKQDLLDYFEEKKILK